MKKSIKVLFAFFFTLFVVLQSVFVGFALDSNDNISENTRLYEACELTTKLGIGSYSYEALIADNDYVTRAEFIKMALKLVLLDDEMTRPLKEKSYFTDVTVADENAGYINAAYDMEIVHGSDLGKFFPNDNITLDQAAKIMISLLGYANRAERVGGFPLGYRTQSYQLGILDEIDMQDTFLKKQDAVIMLYNALEVEYVEENIYDAEWNTVLQEFFFAETETGLVENNRFTHIFGKNVGKNEIVIDGKSYKTDDNNVDFMGMRVKYYYTYDSQTKNNKIIAMFPEECNVLTLRTEDIELFDQGLKEYKYYTKEKERFAKLDSDYTLIYNNQISTTSEYKNFVPTEGFVKLIDNDNDSRYEVIITTDYLHRIVKAINTETKWLTFYTDSSFATLDLGKEEYCVFDKYGNEKTLADITVGMPIAILKSEKTSLNDTLYVIYILTDTVEGTVLEITDEELILQDGTKVKLDQNKDNLYKTEKIELGENGKFYLGMTGSAFAFDTVDITQKDAISFKNEPCLVINLNPDYEAAKPKIFARVLRKSGAIEELKFAESFKVSYQNEVNKNVKSYVKYKNHEDALKGVFAIYDDDYHLVRELALITTNANGEIAEIEFPSLANYLVNGDNGATVDPDLKGDGLHSFFADFKAVEHYKTNNAWFVAGTSYTMSDMLSKSKTSVYFSMPAEHNDSRIEKEYMVVDTFEAETQYLMNFYSFDSRGETIDVGVLKGSTDETPTSDFYAIEKVYMSYDEEYGDRYTIKAYKNASTVVTMFYDPEDEDCPVPSDIGEGDIISVGLDLEQNIKSLYRYVKFNQTTGKPEADEYIKYPVDAPISSKSGFGGTYIYRFGIAYKSPDGEKVYFCNESVVDNYDKYVDICDVSAFTSTMVFDRKTHKWTEGSYKDVICYSDMPDEASYIAYKTLYGSQERVMYIY